MTKNIRSFGECERCGSFKADLRIKSMNSRKYNYYCWGCYQEMKINSKSKVKGKHDSPQLPRMQQSNKIYNELTPYERAKYEFTKNSILYKFYAWLFKPKKEKKPKQ